VHSLESLLEASNAVKAAKIKQYNKKLEPHQGTSLEP
jgi:hypothetical protein